MNLLHCALIDATPIAPDPLGIVLQFLDNEYIVSEILSVNGPTVQLVEGNDDGRFNKLFYTYNEDGAHCVLRLRQFKATFEIPFKTQWGFMYFGDTFKMTIEWQRDVREVSVPYILKRNGLHCNFFQYLRVTTEGQTSIITGRWNDVYCFHPSKLHKTVRHVTRSIPKYMRVRVTWANKHQGWQTTLDEFLKKSV